MAHIVVAYYSCGTSITLERGGNDAAIVLPDVDVAQTAQKAP